jgi:hypothetical protein
VAEDFVAKKTPDDALSYQSAVQVRKHGQNRFDLTVTDELSQLVFVHPIPACRLRHGALL